MKITTRDLLAELMLEALEDPLSSATLHCLAAYCRVSQETPSAMEVPRLLLPVPQAKREDTLARLHTCPLLSWNPGAKSERVTLSPAFAPEWRDVAEKLQRYEKALDAWAPLEETSPLINALQKGALLFNAHLFFEVHEVLEAQWAQEHGEEKRFLQGLIQVAVAFYHRERGNLRGALSLLHDGMEKLAPYRPAFHRVELQAFLRHMEACRAELLRLEEKALTQFRTAMIPRMQFVDTW
jgi:predicted metal-dependent hydrolase